MVSIERYCAEIVTNRHKSKDAVTHSRIQETTIWLERQIEILGGNDEYEKEEIRD